jgi:ribose transport system ATP-binding protein
MHNIGKVFPGVVALDSVDFNLDAGEVHVLLGENGAGKSTLVKILSGAYQRTSGNIRIRGVESDINNPRHAQNLGIAIIYQELNLVPHLSAAANIFLGQELKTRSGLLDLSAMEQKAAILLTDLGVQIDVKCPVKELGVAQQQMIEVAKALLLDARILIMDEPTSALADAEIGQLFATIQRLKKRGVAIIYISHRLEEIFEIGDRVTVLRDGQWIASSNIADVQKSELVTQMVDRPVENHFPKVKAESGPELLKVENISRSDTLTNISFTLRAGEVLGIAGLLGSGRTELARAIFGADPIHGGQIYIKGEYEEIKAPKKAIGSGLGLLTEDRKAEGLVLNLSVRDNICLASIGNFTSWGFVDGKRELAAADEYRDSLRIKTPSLDEPVRNLSGGNQQKVVLSKWLCCDADILIFDEPTRGIDVGAKVEIYQLMNRLVAAGKAIIMISSELPEILGMSDRILVMRDGQIAGEYQGIEASQEELLACALGTAHAA